MFREFTDLIRFSIIYKKYWYGYLKVCCRIAKGQHLVSAEVHSSSVWCMLLASEQCEIFPPPKTRVQKFENKRVEIDLSLLYYIMIYWQIFASCPYYVWVCWFRNFDVKEKVFLPASACLWVTRCNRVKAALKSFLFSGNDMVI